MKVSAASIAYILDAVKTAKLVGVDALIIEPGCLRGVDEKNTRVICHTDNVLPMEFGSIAITRIDTFVERLEMVRSMDGFTVEVEVMGNDPDRGTDKDKPGAMFAKSLTFKAKGVKLDYKATNPLIVKAPRNLKDRLKYRVRLNAETVSYMQKGKAAFGTDEFTLVLTDDGAVIEMTDINNDHLSYKITDTVGKELPDDRSAVGFTNRYSIPYLLPLFKLNPDRDFFVSERVGYLQTQVNNLTVCVLARQ